MYAFSCLNNVDCISVIHVMAFTSNYGSADCDHSHAIEIVMNGQTKRITLPD